MVARNNTRCYRSLSLRRAGYGGTPLETAGESASGRSYPLPYIEPMIGERTKQRPCSHSAIQGRQLFQNRRPHKFDVGRWDGETDTASRNQQKILPERPEERALGWVEYVQPIRRLRTS